ncbi:hypothetical protein ebA5851 [Aromatoleum aromaticum EbN1]|uniref:Uncharacterized protein n=1 Tax=Aromatoleum aromaticum (strain DSM 19018 / LMG 30748 / EbN1) TaxID=76114 RepID=Q5NZR4_AROAE|nr:hypothetical protein ebA5851 [Aromatoleum aromaticum EbN1]
MHPTAAFGTKLENCTDARRQSTAAMDPPPSPAIRTVRWSMSDNRRINLGHNLKDARRKLLELDGEARPAGRHHWRPPRRADEGA